AAVAVIARVEWMPQRASDGVARRDPPFEPAAVGAAVRAHSKGNAVVVEVAEDLAHGPQPLELLEDEADDSLDLLVGIEDQSPAGGSQVTARRQDEQFAAAGLVEHALTHPALEAVQLRLAHDPAQAEQ